MGEADLSSFISGSLGLFTLLALPPLIVAVAVGLVVGILQAATQIQDQTLPQTFKLMAVVLVFAIMMPLVVGPVTTYTIEIFDAFPSMTR